MTNTLIYFIEKKNVRSFCIARTINLFENTLAATVNKLVINELVKLTTFEQMGPDKQDS